MVHKFIGKAIDNSEFLKEVMNCMKFEEGEHGNMPSCVGDSEEDLSDSSVTSNEKIIQTNPHQHRSPKLSITLAPPP
jgi:hypothetical protein